MISYGRHDINAEDIESVASALASDWLTTGPLVGDFERDLEGFTGGVATVAVSSGTAALHCAYAAAGLGPGDEVITPPLTFVATQAAAVHLGATPVFADVRSDSGNLDPDAVRAAITPRTAAIVAVDYAGHPADMNELRAIAEVNGLVLIEDAAHSLGSELGGVPVGSLADITAFSFFPTKNITTGEGGAVASSSDELLIAARRFSHQGLIRESGLQMYPNEGPWHQEVHHFGLNYRLPDVLAALGSSQLRRLPAFKARRREIKRAYDMAFSESGLELTIPYCHPAADPVWHLYPLRVPAASRRRLYEGLRARGIYVQVNYMPAYWHPAFDPQDFPRGLCPVAERFYSEELSLPIHTQLTDSDVTRVVEAVLDELRQAGTA